MKILKKIILGILTLLLINLISLLVISFTFRQVIVDGIITETMKQQIFYNFYKEDNASSEYPSITTNNDLIQEILESDEIKELIDKYIDITIDNLTEEKTLDEIDIEKDMIEYIKENKAILEEKIGYEITDEMLEKIAKKYEDKDISKAFKQTIENEKNNITQEEKTILKCYELIISLKFKIVISILIMLDLLIIAFLQKSFYKWTKTLGYSLFISGIGIDIIGLVIRLIIKNIAKINELNTVVLIKVGTIIGIIGIIIVITYNIIIKTLKKSKGDTNDLSKELN